MLPLPGGQNRVGCIPDGGITSRENVGKLGK